MTSRTTIANMALGHLGVGVEIANVDSDRSREAMACRRFFDAARKETLRGWCWPFATTIAPLDLVQECPNIEWKYSYRYPSGCQEFIKVLSGFKNDTRFTREPYKIIGDNVGRLILTNKCKAEAEYTIDHTDYQNFPTDFEISLSYRLASFISIGITGGDPFKVGDKALQMFQASITSAKISAANEEQPYPVPESEFITERQGVLPPWQIRKLEV